MNGDYAKVLLHYCTSKFCYIGKPTYLSMPKLLAGCHYNEEESNRPLEKNKGYWPVQMNSNKFATGQIIRKPVEFVKERILGG